MACGSRKFNEHRLISVHINLSQNLLLVVRRPCIVRFNNIQSVSVGCICRIVGLIVGLLIGQLSRTGARV